MQNRRAFLINGSVIAVGAGLMALAPRNVFADDSPDPAEATLANDFFEIIVRNQGNGITARIRDIKRGVVWAEGAYDYSLAEKIGEEIQHFSGLQSASVRFSPGKINVRGLLGAFEIEHDITADGSNPFFSENMKITNRGGTTTCLLDFNASFSKKVAGPDGGIAGDLIQDRFQAVPFLHRADDAAGSNGHDYTMEQIAEGWGFVFQTATIWGGKHRSPSRSFISEGWGWRHGEDILGIFSFNQDNMIFSSLSCDAGGLLHFGGFRKEGLNLSILERFEPASTVYLGMNRFYALSGGYNQLAYQYRGMLDEMGCRFPKDFNPPVHWNELYNMNDAWNQREKLYRRANLLEEAKKAQAHSCQALYLDPGWDTAFGSFLWGADRLGECGDYVRTMENDYGLKTSLHTPMPPWASNPSITMGPPAIDTWPGSSRRLVEAGDLLPSYKPEGPAENRPQICMGSKQFLGEAEKRLRALCEAGVTFFMFDGTWWNGPCEDKSHGHPIPYLYEDHINTCIEMARRVHAKYPGVLIEMHDMMNGGDPARSTPVYYKYGLPGSYDENWAFELMWHPLDDIKRKSGLAMYYYALGCNVPLYLHIDTGMDNANNIMLWWFASTARHLGIGGDSPDPAITEKHHSNMKLYIQLQEFFKSGDFYGAKEEIHMHTLPEKRQCVINIFRLSDSPGATEGEISLSEIGLDPHGKYVADKDWVRIHRDKITVRKDMEAWDADLAVIKPV